MIWILLGGMKRNMNVTATPPRANAIGMPLKSRSSAEPI
jgi:hypothetical protein